jgi:hypothetical protein
MTTPETLRIAKSPEDLDRLLGRIESGKLAKPDWIRLQGSCHLSEMETESRQAFLARIHPCVLQGFKDVCDPPSSKGQRLELWQSIARAGFHDFSESGWMKNFDSPFVENYDYISDYQRGGINALDPYKVYSSVLGTFDFTVDDFVTTELCRNVRTIVEPMAGTAEFCYTGHFRYPDFSYLMIDLDEEAKEVVLAQNWLPDSHKEYLVGDVLTPNVWEQVKAKSNGDSLAYIGKQSHHFFDAKQLMRLMDLATQHVDFLMLETPEICLASDMGDTDDLTRQEMKDAGFECELIGEEDGEPNPLTHELSFRLEACKGNRRKTMFNYHGWTYWAHSTLIAFADLLDLKSFYYHSDEEEFKPVTEWDDDADCEENVTFMLFTRRNV